MLRPLQDAILHLFAILSAQGDDSLSQQAEHFIINLLEEMLPPESMNEALETYHQYMETYAGKTGKKGLSAKSVRFLKKAEEISNKLTREERRLICLRTMEFVTQYANNKTGNLDFVKLIADVFLIDDQVYQNMYNVVSGKIRHSQSKQKINLPDALSVLFLSENEIYAKINNNTIPDQPGLSKNLYFRLQYQQQIQLPGNKNLLYSDILRAYTPQQKQPVKMGINQLGFSIRHKHTLFHGLSFSLSSPGLFAITGPSGAGKSTLLKLMAGILKPDNGSIEFSYPAPVLAMVPQDDNINPDLPVRLQLLSQAEKYGIKNPGQVADKTLLKIGLSKKAGCLPGTPENSRLSGGERKRLGIGCAIISNPDILICDEPSSGLSFDDANKIIRLLRNIANENCLVISSLHQPDASILSCFDDMLYLDEGGYPVFFGSPELFPRHIDNIICHTSEKLPDKTGTSPLARAESLIRDEHLDEFGRPTHVRKHPPTFWTKHFNKTDITPPASEKTVPNTKNLRPNTWKTILTEFSAFRNRKKYAAMLLLYAPFMALILAPVCRFSGSAGYDPVSNPHFPVFFIISVVVALFSGLIFSLGELSRKQSEHKRNMVTEKTNKHVILAKLSLLLPAGILQSVIFSLVSTFILDIVYLFLPLAITYFILYFFATATGLLLSALSGGKNWAYLLVPVLLIPQILFSGAMIPWQTFPYHKEKTKAPAISRLFAASWAYESLITGALYLYPGTDFAHEKAYFLSLYFMQDVIPQWTSHCNNTNTSEKACNKLTSDLYQILPQEVQDQVHPPAGTGIDVFKNEIMPVFKASLEANKHVSDNTFPLLWHQIQRTNLPPVEISNEKFKLNMYPLYSTGTPSSYNTAYLSVAGKRFRHAHVSYVVIVLMGLIQYFCLFSPAIRWPWGYRT
ncbi:MAG: ATP-binding cassette domain-containing protein [Bacteroidota bacterium]